MRSTRRLRPAPIAATSALALALAACSSGGESSGSEETSTTPPPTKLSVPDQFDNDSAPWESVSDIQGGGDTATAMSPDGEHYAYAYNTGEGGTLEVGQLDLKSGKQVKEQSIKALSPDASDRTTGGVGLMYSGNRLVLIQAGSDDGGTKQIHASVFQVGSGAKPKQATTAVEGDVALPAGGEGPMVEVSTGGGGSTHYAIDPAEVTVSEIPSGPETFTGCGGADCSLPTKAEAQIGAATVKTWTETAPGGRTVCSEKMTDTSPDENGFDGCMRGFGTQKWDSQDVAPDGAVAESAHLYAVGKEHLIGAWRGEDGGTIYRTINVKDPRAAHAEITCDTTVDGNSTHSLTFSPSGQYAVAGSIWLDTKSNEGHCLEESDEGSDASLSAVDDSGTGWGSTGKSADREAYTSEAVRVGSDGQVESIEGEVALPLSFLTVDGGELATFAVTDDEKAGATVVAAYPDQS